MSIQLTAVNGYDQVVGGDTTTGDGFGINQYSVTTGYIDAFSGGYNSSILGSDGIYCTQAGGAGAGVGGGGGSFFIECKNYIIQQMPSNGENFLYDPNGWVGLGTGALAIGGTLYQNYYSDAKYKDNVTPITNALDRVNAIRGVEFDWNNLANEEQGRTGHDVGVIAQEVQAVYPHAVREVDKEREDHVVTALVVDYEKLIPLLLQSIKELSAEVTSLKQQVNGTNI